MSKLAPKLVEVARREIGVKEVGSSNRGPRVDEYQRATWLDQKDWGAWCAAFICWIVREAMVEAGVPETDKFKRPRTAGAWDFENWSLGQDKSTWTKKPHGGDIQPGDIIVFTFSHIGLATSAPDAAGCVSTIEGNSNAAGSRTGGMVVANRRHVTAIRSRIRFRV